MERDSSLHHLQGQQLSLYKSQVISRPYNYEGFSPSKGLLKAPPPPPPLSHLHSAPTFSLQPPLLPLPLPNRSSSSSFPTVKNGTRKTRPFTSKKSTKSFTENNNIIVPKKEGKKKQTAKTSSDTATITASSSRKHDLEECLKDDRVDVVFNALISPPPSSLPLPRFCLRPKLSCNVDGAATDDLRRLLRLQ